MAQQRTTATDPNYLDTFGSTSRLAFIGGKMIADYFGYHIGNSISLLVIVGSLASGVAYNMFKEVEKEEEEQEQAEQGKLEPTVQVPPPPPVVHTSSPDTFGAPAVVHRHTGGQSTQQADNAEEPNKEAPPSPDRVALLAKEMYSQVARPHSSPRGSNKDV